MQSQDKGEQSCNYEEENEILLSQRMEQLNLAPIKVKSMLSIQEITSSTHLQPQPQHYSLPDCNISKENRMRRSANKVQAQNGKMKGSRFKRISQSKRDRSPAADAIKLFQVTEAANRRPLLTQVKDLRVSQFTGRGMLILPNGKKYQGEWTDGNLVGQVKITYPNGDIYLGGIYNYQKHGKGYMYFVSGEKYEGEFSSGDFHGDGAFFDSTGKLLYQGQWRRGKMLHR